MSATVTSNPNPHAVHAIAALRGIGFELLVCLIIMNRANPADVSWQPVAALLKAFDAGLIALARVGTQSPTPAVTQARRQAVELAQDCYDELIALTKASQVEEVSIHRIDALSVKLRRDLKPALTDLLVLLEGDGAKATQ